MNTTSIHRTVEGCTRYPLDPLVAAYHLADAIHDGQFRKSLAPYITHPRAIAKAMEGLSLFTPQDQAVAILHDTLEDLHRLNGQREQAERLIRTAIYECCGTDILLMVELMTKHGGSEQEYLESIATNSRYPRLTLIKLKDRRINMLDCALPGQHHEWFLGYAQRALDEVYPWLVEPYLATSPPTAHADYAIHLCNSIERQARRIVNGHSELHVVHLAS